MATELNPVIDSLDGVDEKFHGLYVEKDGKFELDIAVKGYEPKARVDEFRQNNIELQKKLSEFEGIDPKEYKTLKENLNADLEKQLEKRTSSMKEDYEGKFKALQDELSQKSGMVERLLIDNTIKEAAIKRGVHKTALDDVVRRAREVFKVEGDQVVARDSNGEKIWDKSGEATISPDHWISTVLVKDAPHFFEPTTGTGAPGSKKTSPTINRDEMSTVDLYKMGLKSVGK